MAEVTVNGKGLEKAINYLVLGLTEVENGIDTVVYGGGDGGITFPGNDYKTNGLLPILREINKIDLCNIIHYALGSIKLSEITDENDPFGKNLVKLQKAAKAISSFLEGDFIEDFKTRNAEQVKELIGTINEMNDLIDSDITSVFPKLQLFKNNLFDIIGTMTQYSAATVTYENLNQIPSAEVQKLVAEIKKVKQICDIIAGLQSVDDIARQLIPRQIQDLQRILDPSQLLPIIKTVLTLAKAVGQIVQKVLKVVRFAKVIIKVLTFILKAMKILIKFFALLFIPLLTQTFGPMDTLAKARKVAEDALDVAIKFLTQIGAIVNIIFNFILSISTTIQDVIVEIETLIFNLQSCKTTEEESMVKQLKIAKGQLMASLEELQTLTARYKTATESNATEKIYNGYTLVIEEETLTDSSVKNKRRRAIAYNASGVMVAATQLTFATSRSLLFEELRLMLVNMGLTADTGAPIPGLAELGAVFGIPETDDAILEAGGYTGTATEITDQEAKDQAEVQQMVSSFVSGLPGGVDLKRSVRSKVDDQQAKLKQDTAEGKGADTTGATENMVSGINTAVDKSKPVKVAESKNPNLLTDAEKEKYAKIAKTTPFWTKVHQTAKAKLAAHEKAVKDEGLI